MADMNFTVEQSNNKQQYRSTLSDYVMEHISTVAHVCIIGFVIYVINLCFLEDVVLFTWHPLLYAIGWMALMTEAVLMITKNNVFSNRISYKLRVRYHWIIQTIAVILSTVGFLVVYINKNQYNKQHFKSWHGIFGLACTIACIPACLSGICALFNIELKKYVSPRLNKLLHAVFGIATVSIGGICMLLSLYTGWFNRRTEGNEDIFVVCFITVLFGVFWSLFRPIFNLYNRIKS